VIRRRYKGSGDNSTLILALLIGIGAPLFYVFALALWHLGVVMWVISR